MTRIFGVTKLWLEMEKHCPDFLINLVQLISPTAKVINNISKKENGSFIIWHIVQFFILFFILQ